jgi:hypothetical protein
MVGRPQNIIDLKFRVQSSDNEYAFLDAYWCMPPSRRTEHVRRDPHPVDNLVDAASAPQAFGELLRRWLERLPRWLESRSQFNSVFELQNFYTIDRLVAAANMFDILPKEVFPPQSPLSEKLLDAREKARALFRALELSPEREGVLNDLGRLGRRNLKRKVRDRALVILSTIGEKFPDLELVLELAVECRNRFVHGTDARLTHEQNHQFTPFFTDALQFVFAASDLVDCGWDLKLWADSSTVAAHPFAHFRIYYQQNLASLREALSKG